jgi:Uma2 family endonuclease
MAIQEQQSVHMTVEEFDVFALLPQNADKILEFIAGEIVEVPSNPYVSKIAGLIITFINMYLFERKIKGHVTGEAGGYMVAGERYAPDVAYISAERQPELAHSGYNPNPPELAVEVISSDRIEEQQNLRIKVSNYLSVGTVVWVVRPEDKAIEVHAPSQTVKIYHEKDTLDGGEILPGFTLPVSAIFE